MKSLLLIIIVCVSLIACEKDKNSPDGPQPPVDSGDVRIWMTTGNKLNLFAEQAPVNFSVDEATNIIRLYPDVQYQEIDGFGAALTGSSAYLIAREMGTANRTTILTELFDPEEGIGISNLRITIGSSDFSTGNYTYCDTEGIENFAISPTDRAELIPVLKEILAISPGLKIIGSPWSPPAWMKTTSTLNGGSLKVEAYGDYATYFVKFIKAYEAEGIPVFAITSQNEPLYQTTSYPSMYMSWEEQNTFIRDYLGPQMSANTPGTQIWLYDHNWDNYQYPISILNDPVTNSYVSGSAFHAYAGQVSAMSAVHNAFPEKGLYFTEISGGGWATDFWANIEWNVTNIFLGTVRNWSRNALLWNLALDEDGGPKNGGCSDCRGVITVDGSTVVRNEEYYSLAHFSRFIRPGSKRIQTTDPSNGLDYCAFVTPDGNYVLVVINTAATSSRIYVKSPSGNFPYTMPGDGLATFVWDE